MQDAFKVGVYQQQFHAQLLALAVDQALAVQLPASLGKQAQGLAQGLAADAAAIGVADLVRFAVQLGR
ncbi:hypothetical protein D3C79_1116390 [compost metagenome]